MKVDKESVKKKVCEFIDSLDTVDSITIKRDLIPKQSNSDYREFEFSPVRTLILEGCKYERKQDDKG